MGVGISVKESRGERDREEKIDKDSCFGPGTSGDDYLGCVVGAGAGVRRNEHRESGSA